MRNSDPYYLAIIEKPKYEVWYKNQRKGFNNWGRLLHKKVWPWPEGRKLPNHLVRKTLMKKLKASNHAAKNCYHRCNRPHKLRGRSRSKTATDLIYYQPSCLPKRLEFPTSSFLFPHSVQPYSDSSLPNNSPPLSWLPGDDKLRSWRWCFSTKQ